MKQAPGCRFAAIAILCLPLMTACFQTPAPEGSPTLREAKRIEVSASPQRAQVAPAPVLEDLARAHRLYSLIDDSAGIIRIHLVTAHLYEQNGQVEPATQNAHLALSLAEELRDPGYLYRALLTLGRLEKDPAMFTRALDHAGNSLQQAVALTYLGQAVEAAGLVRGLSEPDSEQVADLAFVLFAYAQHALDPATAERALQLYKREDNYVGIARSLRLLARIAAEQGHGTQADIYSARAERVEAALGVTSGRDLPNPVKGAR